MTKEEKVAAAQFIQNKMNGVNAVQQRHALPDSSAFIEANPDKFERLPDYGNMFPSDPLVGVPHG